MEHRTRLRGRWMLVVVPLMLAVVLLVGPSPASALTYTVTSTADAGAGTLRDAIEAANLLTGSHTIEFAPALAGSTITLSTVMDVSFGPSALRIDSLTDITIQGDADQGITIQRDAAGPEMRLFYVEFEGVLTLVNTTLQGGLSRGFVGGLGELRGGGGGGSAGVGGAILNEGDLFLRYSTLRENAAIGGDGGDAGTFASSGSGGGGAGVAEDGFDSTAVGGGDGGAPAGGLGGTPPGGAGGFSFLGGGGGGAHGDGTSPNPGGPGGSSFLFGGGGGGGAAQALGFPGIQGGDGGFGGLGGGGGGGGGGTTPGVGGGDLFLFFPLGGDGDPSGNGGGGGGAGCGLGGAVFNLGGLVFLENCTFAFNEAVGGLGGLGAPGAGDGEGGAAVGAGLFNYSGSVDVVHCTFSDGILSSTEPDSAVAGALCNLADGESIASMDLVNVICANSSGGLFDVQGFALNEGFRFETGEPNVIESLGPWDGPVPILADPQLLPIADNGGPTETYALSGVTSPAFDAGDPTAGVVDDQRYVPRDALPDIGAYELEFNDTPPTVTCTLQRRVLPWMRGALVDTGLALTATDSSVPPGPLVVAVGVWSDEANGPAPFTPDAKLLGGRLFFRGDRDIRENGRVYLVRASATDTAGNVGYAACTVIVPRFPTPSYIAAALAEAAEAEAVCDGTASGSVAGDIPDGFEEVLPDTTLTTTP